jgi:hypothetical protein
MELREGKGRGERGEGEERGRGKREGRERRERVPLRASCLLQHRGLIGEQE